MNANVQATSTSEATGVTLAEPLAEMFYSNRKVVRDFNNTDESTDPFDFPDSDIIRYKPESIETLCEITRFSAAEIRVMYQGFKQECPSGAVDQIRFKQIFSRLFPNAKATYYADRVFSTLEKDSKERVRFKDFIKLTSLLSRGDLEDKIRWLFTLYDSNSDGIVCRHDLFDIVSATYCLSSSLSRHTSDEWQRVAEDDAKIILSQMDVNSRGYITYDDFCQYFQQNSSIQNTLSFFDTTII